MLTTVDALFVPAFIKVVEVVRLIFVAFTFVMATMPIRADTVITGQARVIDGDTIEVDGKGIRLHGLDAPERDQLCLNEHEILYPCGRASQAVLADFLINMPIKCQCDSYDRYKRLIAVCYGRGININAWLVEDGWAVAYRKYSSDYISNEEQAKQTQRGLWAGLFIMPWRWRRGERLKGEVE